jgi:RimJ/RimL family protein N-acetyltransferase
MRLPCVFFKKNGFHVEGYRREQVINRGGMREDALLHGLLSREFSEHPVPRIMRTL